VRVLIVEDTRPLADWMRRTTKPVNAGELLARLRALNAA
jgi:hypothetical protein